jgi:hypothetical protein
MSKCQTLLSLSRNNVYEGEQVRRPVCLRLGSILLGNWTQNFLGQVRQLRVSNQEAKQVHDSELIVSYSTFQLASDYACL